MNLKVPQFAQILFLNEPLDRSLNGRGNSNVIREACKAYGEKFNKIRKHVN
jgi:hypothetical protein